MTFLTSFRMKDLLVPYTVMKPKPAMKEEAGGEEGGGGATTTPSAVVVQAESKDNNDAVDSETSPVDVDLELGGLHQRPAAATESEKGLNEEEDLEKRRNTEDEQKARALLQEQADARHRAVSAFFDRIIPPRGPAGTKDADDIRELPQAIILDFSQVRYALTLPLALPCLLSLSLSLFSKNLDCLYCLLSLYPLIIII